MPDFHASPYQKLSWYEEYTALSARRTSCIEGNEATLQAKLSILRQQQSSWVMLRQKETKKDCGSVKVGNKIKRIIKGKEASGQLTNSGFSWKLNVFNSNKRECLVHL